MLAPLRETIVVNDPRQCARRQGAASVLAELAAST